MTARSVLGDVHAQRRLTEKLARCTFLREPRNSSDESEEAKIAYDLAELEESFRRFLEQHLPRLAENDLNDEEIHDLLLEIADEFRHVLYHIKDSRFFRSLVDDR